MKINRLLLPIGKSVNYKEDIDLSYFRGDQYHVRSISSCHMDLDVTNYEDLITLFFKIKGEVKTTCAYTLEEIPYEYNISDVIELSGGEDDEFEIKNEEINIDEMLITLIVSNVPFKVVKEGATLPSDGDGYRFISEEQAEAETKEKPSPFDVLDDFDFDDEEDDK